MMSDIPGQIEITEPVSEDETWVYFTVFDCDDPFGLDERLKIQASISWVEGDSISELFPDAKRTRSKWILTSGLGFDTSYKDHFIGLLEKLEARAESLKEIMTEYPAGIGVSQFFYESKPEYFIEKEITERFGALGLKVSFDQLGIHDND